MNSNISYHPSENKNCYHFSKESAANYSSSETLNQKLKNISNYAQATIAISLSSSSELTVCMNFNIDNSKSAQAYFLESDLSSEEDIQNESMKLDSLYNRSRKSYEIKQAENKSRGLAFTSSKDVGLQANIELSSNSSSEYLYDRHKNYGSKSVREIGSQANFEASQSSSSAIVTLQKENYTQISKSSDDVLAKLVSSPNLSSVSDSEDEHMRLISKSAGDIGLKSNNQNDPTMNETGRSYIMHTQKTVRVASYISLSSKLATTENQITSQTSEMFYRSKRTSCSKINSLKMSHPATTTNSIKHPSNRSSNPWGNDQSDMGPEVAHSLPHHHHSINAGKEELRQRELEEARTRAAQMEKTMRWWSDCTANWREKWSKVRTERNKLREESRILRGKLENLSKDHCTLKREKQQLEDELEVVKSQTSLDEISKNNFNDTNGYAEKPITVENNLSPINSIQSPHDDSIPSEVSQVIQAANEDLEFLDKLLQKNDCEGMELCFKEDKANETLKSNEEPSIMSQKLSFLQYKLEEALKTIETEKLENSRLLKNVDELRTELQNERKNVPPEHDKEELKIKASEEESSFSLEEKMSELREQLEKLQVENAAEWGRCETLETEKATIERENKKLKATIQDLEDRMERKNKQMAAPASDVDVKSLQLDLYEKNKELSELKHGHNKLKKILQDKSTELNHSSRRAEQYEGEVKKLRARIEELKKELMTAEDEVDNSTNTIRKLQRTNEELREHMVGLQSQMESLQNNLTMPSSMTKDTIESAIDAPEFPGVE